MASGPPPHCQIRSTISQLQTVRNDVNRSLAAMSMFCQEGDLETVSAEAKRLRLSFQKDVGSLTNKLEHVLVDLAAMKSENTSLRREITALKTQIKDLKDVEITALKTQIKNLKDEELSFSEAISHCEDSQSNDSKDNEMIEKDS